MNVLLGWELGAGQGHIQRLVAIAEKLELCGYTPVFALKSFNLKGIRFVWQSVIAPPLPYSGREDSYTFADILATFGFGDANLLQPHLQAWQDLLTAINPCLVITDHAPGLALAAQGRVPVVVLGSHFAVPPPVDVFPILRFPAPPESNQRQDQVSETVHRLLKLNVPLGHALNGDRSFIFSIPELDCYRCWRTDAQYVGVHIAPLPTNSHSKQGATWAYLSSDYPHTDLILETLAPEHDFKSLQEALIDKSLAVHHGGLTTSISCLLAGIPQIILPTHFEQQLNAIALQQMGVAKMVFEPTWESLLMIQSQAIIQFQEINHITESYRHWNQNFLGDILDYCLSIAS